MEYLYKTENMRSWLYKIRYLWWWFENTQEKNPLLLDPACLPFLFPLFLHFETCSKHILNSWEFGSLLTEFVNKNILHVSRTSYGYELAIICKSCSILIKHTANGKLVETHQIPPSYPNFSLLSVLTCVLYTAASSQAVVVCDRQVFVDSATVRDETEAELQVTS